MKNTTAILLLCVFALLPVHAEDGATSQETPAASAAVSTESDAQALKRKTREEERVRDDKIKDLEKTVAKEPGNRTNRLALIDFLESLAADCDKKNDPSGAWRYYQRAAAALRDPKEDSWEARAADDTTKAAAFRVKATEATYREEEARAVARRSREMPAIMAPSFDWRSRKDRDLFSENRYREDVWKKVQTAWLNSELRRAIVGTDSFKTPAVVSFDVHTDGEVSDIKIITSSGDRRIDLAALKVVEDLGKMEPLLPGMGSLVRFQTEFGK